MPRGNTHFIRVEGEHLSVPRDHIAFGVDHRSGVVDLAILLLEDAARQQPDTVLGRCGAHLLFESARDLLGIMRERAVCAKLAEHHHVHPRVDVHEDVELQLHGLHIAVGGADAHLDAGYREWFHACS